MVKNTQTIRPQRPTNCLSVFDHFVVLALKELTTIPYTNKKLFTTQNCALTHTYLKSICYFQNTGRKTTEEGIFDNFKATSAA